MNGIEQLLVPTASSRRSDSVEITDAEGAEEVSFLAEIDELFLTETALSRVLPDAAMATSSKATVQSVGDQMAVLPIAVAVSSDEPMPPNVEDIEGLAAKVATSAVSIEPETVPNTAEAIGLVGQAEVLETAPKPEIATQLADARGNPKALLADVLSGQPVIDDDLRDTGSQSIDGPKKVEADLAFSKDLKSRPDPSVEKATLPSPSGPATFAKPEVAQSTTGQARSRNVEAAGDDLAARKDPTTSTSTPSGQTTQISGQTAQPITQAVNSTPQTNAEKAAMTDTVVMNPQIGLSGERTSMPISVAPMATPTTQLQPAQIANAIAVHIDKVDPSGGAQQIELRLDPEELGKLKITFTPREAGFLVTLGAERQDTLELLRRHAGELMQDLDAMGLGGAQLEFQDHQGEAAMPKTEDDETVIFADAPLERPMSQPTRLVVSDDRLDIRL